MQEELGETMGGDSDGGSMWLCPLCQQGQLDRDGLSLHLAEKHSVLPACLDKLLDIADPKHCSSDESRESSSQKDINGTSQQQCSENLPLMESPNEAVSSASDQDGSTHEKEMCDESGDVGNGEEDWSNIESNQDNVTKTERSESSASDEKCNDKSNAAADSDVNHPFKCHACLEFFPTRSALSVHYNSATHILRMRTGNDSDSSAPTIARPYVSNKPYQCAVCRVSYNHAITLESHLKSVLHQSRSRNAGNAATNSTTSAGNGNVAANMAATTVANTTQLNYVTTSNCVSQPSLTASQAVTKDEQIKPQPAPSLLSSPVASAQAVSAFLTLLTSSPNSVPHSVLPSLFAAGSSAAPSTTAPQLITQPQMLMPLILNGLQSQSPTSESPKQLLQQAVPVLGLSAAQQALLAQGLSGLQSQWAAFRLSNAAQMPSKDNDNSIDKGAGTTLKNEEQKQESCDQQVPQTFEEAWTTDEGSVRSVNKAESKKACNDLKYESKCVEDSIVCIDEKQEKVDAMMEGTSEEGENASKTSDANKNLSAGQDLQHSYSSSSFTDPCLSPTHIDKNTVSSEIEHTPAKCNLTNTNLALKSSQQKRTMAHAILSSAPPVLSEFQSQVLWAFIESRDEADSEIPPREDCEALGREVGLTEDEVRRWLVNARRAKGRYSAEAMEHDEMEGSIEDEEGDLMIDESEYGQSPSASSGHAMDLSNSSEIHKEKVYSQNQGDLCLTSDSENEEFYTSVIVTDEESQSSSLKEEPGSPVKQPSQVETSGERSSGGGKVLRSTTVFLSDAEDEDEDQNAKNKKRKREMDKEESECKKEKHDADLDLQLEAQADPPTPLSVRVDHHGLPAGILHPLPLSLSLAPFSTQLFSPYVLSVPSSVVGVSVSEADRAKVVTFTSPPTIPRTQAPFSDPLQGASMGPLAQSTQFMSNGSECESALDLSIGKNQSSSTTSSVSANSKVSIQKTALLDGLGLRPTTVGVPADGSLIVVQVKPDPSTAIPNSNTTIGNHNSLAKTSTVFMRAAEKINASLKEGEQEKARDQKRVNVRRFRDMRRSRTIIQADQLDVLYGCYFKDPNPGKHEFEQISEWVHLPKKVVQIWFQNMRARERKGEVRFISDGTLAAVGKPLIKFTWPLSKPIFSSTPKSSSSPTTPGWVPPKPQSGNDLQKTEKPMEVKEPQKVPIQGLSKPKEVASTTTANSTAVLRTKGEAMNAFTMVKIAPKTVAPLVTVPILNSSSAIPQNPLKTKLEGQNETDRTELKDGQDQEKHVSGTASRIIPKISTTPINKSSTVATQKHNGINYWSPKGQIKINTLSREQLGLSTPRPIISSTSVVTPSMTITSTSSTQKQKETNYIQQHSTPRRPRTHLNCLQLSILQSCYETCAHPNALECEAVGTELGLPLKVVQIWFQNTRAKEKRWRLQQEKLSPNSSDPSKKLDMSSGTYLQYNALRANRPILPKPVQLTILESSPSSAAGQPAARETLRGKCEVCNVEFESRATARDHVFSPRHLATLRTTNFGQSATQINNGAAGVVSQMSSKSPAGSTS